MIQMGNMCKYVIILILSLGIVSGQQCTQQNIDNCIQPFTAYRNVANFTEPMLNEACSKVSNISVCVTNSGCPADDPMVKATWTGLQDGFNYLCGKKSDVLSKVSCWHNNDTRSILEACQNAYNATARAALCDAVNKLLACTKTGLTTRCGADSADLYVTYTYKVLYPAIKALQSNCTLNDLSGSSAGVAFSASFITVLLASSALLLML